jgi:MtN3 and saliva related transmembrane protein
MKDLLGYSAAVATTLAFVPQVVQVWRTRSADDISLAMYVLFMAGLSLWIAYGMRIGSVPVVAANGVTLLLAAAVLVGKVRFRRRPTRGGARSAPHRIQEE